MYQRFARAFRSLHRGQRGMTGLETAIILIAFVTVASVLAYSVLSAGIFSAERGKETVYSGLAQAQSTLDFKGVVLGNGDSSNASVQSIEFNLSLAVPGTKVDREAIVFNYWDSGNATASGNTTYAITATSIALATGSTERGVSTVIEGDEVFRVELPLLSRPSPSETFTIQVIPPKGATLTIQRTLPARLYSKNILD